MEALHCLYDLKYYGKVIIIGRNVPEDFVETMTREKE